MVLKHTDASSRLLSYTIIRTRFMPRHHFLYSTMTISDINKLIITAGRRRSLRALAGREAPR